MGLYLARTRAYFSSFVKQLKASPDLGETLSIFYLSIKHKLISHPPVRGVLCLIIVLFLRSLHDRQPSCFLGRDLVNLLYSNQTLSRLCLVPPGSTWSENGEATRVERGARSPAIPSLNCTCQLKIVPPIIPYQSIRLFLLCAVTFLHYFLF